VTTPSRLLDFFTLEAAEYLSRIEAAIASETADVEALRAGARGLRGSATMARSTPIANIAGRLETIAGKISSEELQLSDPLRRLIGATAETLNTLVRSVRSWTSAQDELARRARDELDMYAPGADSEPEDVIVPISQLFYSDGGPHIVEVASTARTTFEQRLREKQTRATPHRPMPAQPMPPRPANQPPVRAGLRGAALRDALGSSIAQMRSIERPGEPPAPPLVPIQSLLYRGDAAVKRSQELRAQIMSAKSAPSRDVIAELCDLVELARAE
jgi:chemotaxis protein histidine kinase CheA